MSTQPEPITIITVDNHPAKAKKIIAQAIKDLSGENYLVHVANCEAIQEVRVVLQSLITPPSVLICSCHWFAGEEEEIREEAAKIYTNMHLIMIPSDIHIEDDEATALSYLKEQLSVLGLPKRV